MPAKTTYTTRGLARQELRRAVSHTEVVKMHISRVVESHGDKVDDDFDQALALILECLDNAMTLANALHDRI